MRVKSLDLISCNSITPESDIKVMRVKETITIVGKEALTKANNPCKYHGKNIEDGKETLENLQTDVMV